MTPHDKFQLCLEQARAIVARYRADAPNGCDPISSYIAVAGAVVGVAGGAIQGFASSSSQNSVQGQIQAAYSHLPPVPDLNKEFLNGYFKQIQITPEALALDRSFRSTFARPDMQRAANLYGEFLPQFAATNNQTLKRIDPEFTTGRRQLYNTVSEDLAAGSSLTHDEQGQIEQYLRAAQTARGNVLGNAPVSAEAFTKGAAGQQLKEQRISDMGNFLRGPGPTDKFSGLAGGAQPALTAGLASASNPGYSYIEGPHDWNTVFRDNAQTQYQDALTPALAQAQALAGAPPQTNPWMSALSGGLGSLGGSIGGLGKAFGGGGAAGGGGGGGAVTGYFNPSARASASGYG